MKTKEDILEQMRIEMPFNFPERIKPYVMEAMDIYALESCKEALKNASENAKVMTKNTDTGNELEVLSWTDSSNVKFSVSKQSILSINNLPDEIR